MTVALYDTAVAAHYAAYRPPLHRIILQRVFSTRERFATGVDVGCGTGYSAIALASHCERVCAVDPGASMLAGATAHPAVRYVRGRAERLPIATGSVDVVTFAGSLFYADLTAAGEEVKRVCRHEAVIVVYDFEVLLDDLLRRHGIDPHAVDAKYDHRRNFSGVAGLAAQASGTERLELDVTPDELAHVLLADAHRLRAFSAKYAAADPFPALSSELRRQGRSGIPADIFHSKYRVSAG